MEGVKLKCLLTSGQKDQASVQKKKRGRDDSCNETEAPSDSQPVCQNKQIRGRSTWHPFERFIIGVTSSIKECHRAEFVSYVRSIFSKSISYDRHGPEAGCRQQNTQDRQTEQNDDWKTVRAPRSYGFTEADSECAITNQYGGHKSVSGRVAILNVDRRQSVYSNSSLELDIGRPSYFVIRDIFRLTHSQTFPRPQRGPERWRAPSRVLEAPTSARCSVLSVPHQRSLAGCF